MLLEGLGRVGRLLGRQRAHLLGLRRQRAELLPPKGRLQLDHVGEALGAGQALGEVEARIEVPPGDVDDLWLKAAAPWPAASKDFSKVATDASNASVER